MSTGTDHAVPTLVFRESALATNMVLGLPFTTAQLDVMTRSQCEAALNAAALNILRPRPT